MNVTSPLPTRRGQQGFSLVEIMVGIVVGMVGLLVIYKTLSVWDTHTRTTTSGGDAQVAGTLAMYNLERDIKLAGMGFGTADPQVMGCTVTGFDSGTGRVLSFPLYPVQIAASGPAGSPDSISVLSGNSSFFVSAEPFTFSSATTKKLTRREGFRRGDLAVVAGNPTGLPATADCQLVQITDNTDPDGFTVSHNTGTYVPDPAYSAATAASAAFNAGGGTGATFSSGTMYNLGPSPELNLWQITGRVLSRAGYIHGTPSFEISEGIINMKAQYGVDADGDNKIADSEWVTTTPVDWTRVRAIRVAILVRSSQFEKPPADSASATAVAVTRTANTPAWAGGTFLMTSVDGTADTFSDTDAVPNNWRFYRYRVYEKVIPLRNMIWGTSP